MIIIEVLVIPLLYFVEDNGVEFEITLRSEVARGEDCQQAAHVVSYNRISLQSTLPSQSTV